MESEIPETVYTFGPQLNAFMAVGILLKYFRRKLLQFEWRQCRILVCPALYRWSSWVPLLLLQELNITTQSKFHILYEEEKAQKKKTSWICLDIAAFRPNKWQ